MDPENNKDEYSLPNEVIDRINIGIIGVSLSMYDEGMTIEELSEVTGIPVNKVHEAIDFFVEHRMVKKLLTNDNYKVINFKKMLSLLINLGLIFPISELHKKPSSSE